MLRITTHGWLGGLYAVAVLLFVNGNEARAVEIDLLGKVFKCYRQERASNPESITVIKDVYPASVYRIVPVKREQPKREEVFSGTAVLFHVQEIDDGRLVGYFVTAAHTVEPFSSWSFDLRRYDLHRSLELSVPAEVIDKSSEGRDVAILKADLSSTGLAAENFKPFRLRLGALLNNRLDATMIAFEGPSTAAISRTMESRLADPTKVSSVRSVHGIVFPGNSGSVLVDNWALGYGVVLAFTPAELSSAADTGTLEKIFESIEKRQEVTFTPFSEVHDLLVHAPFVRRDVVHELIETILSDPSTVTKYDFEPLSEFEFLTFLYELKRALNEPDSPVPKGDLRDVEKVQTLINSIADNRCLYGIEALIGVRYMLTNAYWGVLKSKQSPSRIVDDSVGTFRSIHEVMKRGKFDSKPQLKKVLTQELYGAYEFAVNILDKTPSLTEKDRKYFGYVLAEYIQIKQESPKELRRLYAHALNVDPTNPVLLDNLRIAFRDINKPVLAAYAVALAAATKRPGLNREKLAKDYKEHLVEFTRKSDDPNAIRKASTLAVNKPGPADLGMLRRVMREGAPTPVEGAPTPVEGAPTRVGMSVGQERQHRVFYEGVGRLYGTEAEAAPFR